VQRFFDRVSEDGVLPIGAEATPLWDSAPGARLSVGLQFTGDFRASRGNMYVLGEAYAFGLYGALLSFPGHGHAPLQGPDATGIQSAHQYPHPRVEVPIGLSIICLILVSTAV